MSMHAFRGAADFFKCMFAKIGAFFNYFLFLKLSYFCDKHLISFEDNIFPQICIFYTALVTMVVRVTTSQGNQGSEGN